MAFNHLHLSPQLPVTIGQKDSASSLSVVLASDYSLAVALDNSTGAGAVDANTLRVVIATDQTAVPITDNGGSVTVDGTVAATQSGTWNITNVSGTVSLPTGAATETTLASLLASSQAVEVDLAVISDQLPAALGSTAATDSLSVALSTEDASVQSNIKDSVASIDTKLDGITNDLDTISSRTPALGQVAMAASVPVALASDQSAIPVSQSGTWAIDGVATEATLVTATTALGNIESNTGSLAGSLSNVETYTQSSASTLSSIDTKLPAAIGTQSSGLSLSVTQAIRSSAALYRVNYTSTNVTTGGYVEVKDSTNVDIRRLHIFDSSGSALYLAVGAAGSEVNTIYIPPGGIEAVDIDIPSGSRLSVKAVDVDATSGQILITALS